MANTHENLGSLFASIASSIRAKTGSTEAIVADTFPEKIAAIDTQEDLSAEMTAQDSLIAQIATALDGKASPAPVSEYIEVAVKGFRRYSYVDENKQVQSVWGGEDVTIRAYKGVVVNEGGGMSNAIGDHIRVYADEVYIFLSDGGVLEPD